MHPSTAARTGVSSARSAVAVLAGAAAAVLALDVLRWLLRGHPLVAADDALLRPAGGSAR